MDFIKELLKDDRLEKDFQDRLGKYKPQFSDELGVMKAIYNEQVKELAAWRFDAQVYEACVEAEPHNKEMKEMMMDKQRGYKLKQIALKAMREQILKKIELHSEK